MKKIFLAVFFFMTQFLCAQPGKYAGSMKKMLNKNYTDEKHISGLTGWTFQEGSLITRVDDPETMTADVFKKGTTYIVLFSIKEDTADTKFTIADVLEVKNVTSTQYIRTGTCQEGQSEGGMDIVALLKKENKDSSKAIKAWRLNRDKRRIETMSPKLVKCMNEVD
jgi:hypothetical protein